MIWTFLGAVLGLTVMSGAVLGAAVRAVLDDHHFRVAVARPHARHKPGPLFGFGAANPFQTAARVLMKNREH